MESEPGPGDGRAATEPAPTQQYSLEFSEENRVFILSEDDSEVVVAIGNEPSHELVSLLEYHHGKKVRFSKMEPAAFVSALGKVHIEGMSRYGDASLRASGIQIDAVQGDAPIVNFINGMLIDAIRAKASDIHIEAFSSYGQVRFRIDGSLLAVTRFPLDRYAAVSARIKIMANLNIMEKRLPQDGRVTVDIGSEKVDLRVSIVPIARGESIVLRLFGQSRTMMSLSELGMDEGMLDASGRMLGYPHGLILVTGPTGSGKTTTLNAMLRCLESDTDKIISIEDPIEYVLDGISQIQTNEAIGLNFETLLRRVLRQDPNVIMVGEVRDHGTAELVVRAALTGHLVLSTLHTNDSVSAVSRLKNIGIEPFLIAATLRGVVAQRLVRRLCPKCKERAKPSSLELSKAARFGVALDHAWRPKGCPLCRNTGFDGRFAIYEHFLMDEALEEAIVQGGKSSSINGVLESKGMKSLAKSGLERMAEGETTLEELEREVEL